MATQSVLTPSCVLPLLPARSTPSSAIRRRLPVRRVAPARAAAEGPRAPARPAAPVAPAPPSPAAESSAPAAAPTQSPASSSLATVSMEYQRQMAKEMVTYFQEKKFEDVSKQGRVFGWTKQNEVGNGRWVMFGLLVGLLTEFATGVPFPAQIQIIFENLGLVD